MLTELSVIGAGGHAKVVVDAIRNGDGKYQVTVVDQDQRQAGARFLHDMTIEHFASWAGLATRVHIAIGDNGRRQQLACEALQNGKQLISVIHPGAQVSSSSVIAAGCFLAAGSIVAAEARVGEACIVNHGAVIDHDCLVDAYSHIGPNATLGGGVQIGRGCLIGSGATLLPGIRVGKNATVGAGSLVNSNVKEGQVVVGVPAKGIKNL